MVSLIFERFIWGSSVLILRGVSYLVYESNKRYCRLLLDCGVCVTQTNEAQVTSKVLLPGIIRAESARGAYFISVDCGFLILVQALKDSIELRVLKLMALVWDNKAQATRMGRSLDQLRCL